MGVRLDPKPELPLTVAIIGGGGYIGYHIGLQFMQEGHEVTLFDIRPPDTDWIPLPEIQYGAHLQDQDLENQENEAQNPHRNQNGHNHNHNPADPAQPQPQPHFVQGSVTKKSDLVNMLKESRAQVVIHSASYGMSGREQLHSEWDDTEEVNVTGSVNVVEACAEVGTVSALVYTSTFNVVFGGQEIFNGDETMEYFPLHRHVDHYSRTKAIAEQLILLADGKGALRTCALRLAGVMGVGEKRHLPRIVKYLPHLKFLYGDPDMQVQFVSLENVCQAHIKAAEGLLHNPKVVGAQAYFISDGEPINNFEYLRPLIEGLDFPFPEWSIPLWFMWGFVYTSELLNCILHYCNPSWTFSPFLTPCELLKTSVTHHFSIDKAREQLQYEPIRPNDISAIVKYFRQDRDKIRIDPYYETTDWFMIFSLALSIGFAILCFTLIAMID